jgi:hypothetical protein
MRSLFLLLTVTGALSAQSMMETGALVGGATVGGVAGKKVSESITATFGKTRGITEHAAVTPATTKPTGANPAAASGNRTPTLQVSPGFVKPEANNVPPPPPPRRAQARPAPPRPVAVPVVYQPEPEPVVEPRPALDVDLTAIEAGTPRTDLLAQGDPSARITMFEDGHLVEIFSYRNATYPWGSVRLIDGAVAIVQVRQ